MAVKWYKQDKAAVATVILFIKLFLSMPIAGNPDRAIPIPVTMQSVELKLMS